MSAPHSEIKRISFTAEGFQLNGTLHLPAVARPPVVVGCHGLYSSQQSPKQIALAAACAEIGIAYFRFDHRGCGVSQGEFQQVTSLSARSSDLKMAVKMLHDHVKIGNRIGVFGSSMGGTVCLNVAAELKIDVVVTFAAPLCSKLPSQNHRKGTDSSGESIYLNAKQYDFDISEKISGVRRLLVIHGSEDETVPKAHADEIYRLADEPKKLIIQPGGDHRMSDTEHQQAFIREASEWLKYGLIGGYGINHQ